MQKWMRCLPLAVALPSVLSAQSMPSAARLSGVAFDSVAGAPLSHAIVQAILVDSAAERVYTTIADTSGRFSFTALPTGRVALRFEHEALDVLGIDSPVRLVTVGDTALVENLSISSGAAVRDQVCPHSEVMSLVVGRITIAQTGQPLVGASVVATWSDLVLDHGAVKFAPHELATVADSAGRYHFCEIPYDAAASIRVTSSGYSPLESDLQLQLRAAVRRDVRLSAVGTSAPASVVRLRIVNDSGKAILNGRAELAGLDRLAPIDSGEVELAGVPAGTWEVSLRSLGYAPKTVVIDAPLAQSPMTVSLEQLPHLLDSMVVRSRASIKDDKVLHEIRERLKVASGTLITADNLSVRNSIEASDAVAVAKGFIWKGSTKVTARPWTNTECRSIEHADGTPKSTRTIAIYLDGSRVPGGLEMVNRMVPPPDILAIEAYPDLMSAPFLWRTNDACAVIAFWTKHLGR
jgi:hypothetical protein